MEDIARHIVTNHQRVQAAIDGGEAAAVDLIGKVAVEGKAKPMNYFVFATKYCSWSNQASFPIYDSRVGEYLLSLHRHHGFNKAKFLRGEDWSYGEFRTLIDSFRSKYGLGNFSYKDIDKFLYTSGTALFAEREAKKMDSVGM